jgi:TRAP-type C4-dicarboxylate transport system permease small subunit
MFDRINARLGHLLLAAAALLAFVLGFLVVADVIGRGAFGRPVKGTPEIVSMSIVIICFLLASYAVQSGSMIRTDVLIDRFGWRGDLVARLLTGVLGAGFFALIVWGSFEPALYAWTSGEFEGEGALRVPAWPARMVVLVGSLLVMITYVAQALRAVAALMRGNGATS